LLGLALELTKRSISKDENPNNVRIAELSAYFTHCELNDAHVQLTLKSMFVLVLVLVLVLNFVLVDLV
jgi:coatomer protein complex subunit alpha (xenin)